MVMAGGRVRRRRGGGGGRLPVVLRSVRVQPGEDQHHDQDQDDGDRGGRSAETAWAVVDGVDDPVFVPRHEGLGGRLGVGVVERHGLGRIGHGRRRDRRHNGSPGLGEPHGRRPRDAERAGGIRHAVGAVLLAAGRVRPDLLERVQLAVVVLHGMHVVAGAPEQEHDRGDAQHDHDTDEPSDHHPYSTGSAGAQHRGPTGGNSGRDRGGPRPPAAPASGPRARPQEARRGRMSPGMSLRRGLLWSRVERMGSVIPQSAPTAGSSQANPSSSAGS